MPRDGAIVLSDLQRDGLAVQCAACDRSGRHSATADCPRRKAGGFRDVCKARFEF
jgi:hypothetical protein